MEGVLTWLLENPRGAELAMLAVIYILGCIIKSKIVADAALGKVTDALEGDENRPAREAVQRTSVGSLVDTVIASRAAKSDPEPDKKPESKVLKGLRFLNILAGVATLLKK